MGGGNSSAQTDVTSTYLTNANFSAGTPIDDDVCTYGKDMSGNGTSYYGAQAISGWTDASEGETVEDYPNSKLAGALFAYGGTPWLAGAGNTAPATDPNGNTGNAAGLCAVWGGKICYTQSVTLPAGSYTLRFKVYNATVNNGSGKFITTNLFGFKPNSGAAYYAPSKTFAIGQWSTIAVTFQLTEETAGVISMGYVGPGGGAAMPHLFVDNVKILKNTYFEDVTNKVGVKAAKNESNPDWIDSGDGLQGSVTTDDGRSTGMAARYGTSAAGTVISQTVKGLKKGTYEVVVYAYSQNEWNNNGATLQNDAGDVGYVKAEGATTVSEWINARRGPGYPADGPGIYSLSGVVVGDNGNLKLSYEIDKANQTEWHAIQIKSLIYTCNDLTEIKTLYSSALAAANGAKDNAAYVNVIGKENTDLTDAISSYGNVTGDDMDLYSSATMALTNATNAFINAKANYDAYFAMKSKANGVKAQTSAYTDPGTAVSTLEGVIATADEAVLTATAATIGVQTDNVRKAAFAFLGNVTLKDNQNIDITAFITNAGFDSNLDNGWTIKEYAAYDGNNSTWHSYSTSNSCGEFYQAKFDISQTLTDLPVGKSFKLKVQAFQRPGEIGSVYSAYGDSEDKTKNVTSEIYVNAKAQKIKNIVSEYSATRLYNPGDWTGDSEIATSKFVPNSMAGAREYFDEDYEDEVKFYENEVAAAADESGLLKFGFRDAVSGASAWILFDNFRLYYAGDDLSGFAADLTAVINSVKTAIDGMALSDAVKTMLKGEADSYEKSYNSAAAYTEAISAVNAIQNTTAPQFVAAYAEFNTLKASANTLKVVDNDDEAANGTFTTAITTQEGAAESATTVAALESATSALKAAMTTYVGAANPVGDNAKFDCTFMLTNPNLDGFANGSKPEGWYCDYSGDAWHEPKVNRNATSGAKNATFEFWTETAVATNEFTVYQKVTLPVGTYEMTCWAFADANGVEGATNNQVYFYANETQGSKIVSEPNKLAEASISFVNSEEKEVKIGLKALEGNQYRWMGMGYVELYKVPAQTFVVNEAANYDYTQSGAGAVTLTRTFNKGYNSLVLPFSMTQDEVEANFGEGAKVYVVSAFDASVPKITFAERSGIAPNQPCILKIPAALAKEFEIENRTLVASDNANPVYAGEGISMIGNYTVESPIAQNAGNYILYNGDLYLVDSNNVEIDGTRAYFNVPAAAGSRVLSVTFEGGEATGIAEIEDVEIADGLIYNLAGQVVGPDYKGIAIINGKKVLMK